MKMKFLLIVSILLMATLSLTQSKSSYSSKFNRKAFIYGQIETDSLLNSTQIDSNSTYSINFRIYDAFLADTDSTITKKELRNVKVRFPFYYRIKIPKYIIYNENSRYALSVTIREFTNDTLAYLTDTATFLQPRKFKYNLKVIKIY
jgi:hypothetical protein